MEEEAEVAAATEGGRGGGAGCASGWDCEGQKAVLFHFLGRLSFQEQEISPVHDRRLLITTAPRGWQGWCAHCPDGQRARGERHCPRGTGPVMDPGLPPSPT